MKNTSNKINNILVSYNAATPSNVCINYGIALAKQLNAKLFMCKIVAIPMSTSTGMGYSSFEPPIYPATPVVDEETTQEDIKSLKENFPKLDEIEFKSDTLSGDLTSITEAYINEKNIDLTCISSSGQGGFAEFLFGSVVKDMVERTDSTVFIVPDTVNNILLPKKIALGVSSEKIPNEAQLNYLKHFVDQLGATLNVVNIKGDEHDVESNVLRVISERLGSKENPYQLTNDKAEKGIQDFVEDQHSEMLILIYKERNFFSKLFHHSVTSEAIKNLSIPVLIVK